MSRLVLALVVAALLAAPLGACGKKGSLEPPGGAKPSESNKKDKKPTE